MLTFHNEQHELHHGKLEMFRGELVPCFEVPDRVNHVLRELKARGLGPVATAPAFPASAVTRIHSQRYVDFLEGAWREWGALEPANAQRDAIPSFWAYQLGVKADANPGVDNVAYVRTKNPSTFQIRCAELCGLWHGYMSDTGRVVSAADFATWIAARRRQFAPSMKYLPKYAPSYAPDPTFRAG